jgi:hypothetical protein
MQTPKVELSLATLNNNDTGKDKYKFFTGSKNFQVSEIEVFKNLLDSRIISDIPEIFAEFRRKQFSLLWRGSRDGFEAEEFHRRCDGHANTLTVILDMQGNIFGGFTPMEWESPMESDVKEDDISLTCGPTEIITFVQAYSLSDLIDGSLSSQDIPDNVTPPSSFGSIPPFRGHWTSAKDGQEYI